MKKVSGTLNGTGAALVVGCGFKPDYVKLWNLESSNPIEVVWSSEMRSLEQIEGVANDNGTPARLAFGAGVAPYRGGDVMGAASTVYLVPVEDIAGKRDMRDMYVAGGGSPVTEWTLDTAGNRTGSFNVEASTTYVGEGSKIRIFHTGTKKTYEVTILAMTSNGEAADEVTLSEAVPSGEVQFIGPMFDYVGAADKAVIPEGFKINSTGNINSSGELVAFEAGTYL